MVEQHDNVKELDLLTSRRLTRIGAGILIAVFGGLFLWSVIAPIDGAVIAPGQVTIEGNRKTVQHLEGGVVKEIYVHEGQQVNQGDVLVRLDNTDSGANLALIDKQLAEIYAQRARLIAERDGEEEIGEVEGVSAVLDTPEFMKNLAGQRQLLAARTATNNRQIELIEEQIAQQEKRIGGLNAQQTSVSGQLKLINEELKGVRELHEEGFAPMTRVRAIERERERLEGQRGSLISSIAESDSNIAEGRLEIERLKEVAREKAIEQWRAASVSIAELEERRVAAAYAVERSEIKAPQSGQVIGLAVHTVGGVIAPGGFIADIVPNGDRLEITARIAPRDVDKVHAGQDALIRFSAFSARRTPRATGIVRSVSGDRLIDPISKASYYLVLIDLPDAAELSKVLRGEALVAGMPAETFIKTGKQPAISYLLRPLTDAISRSMRDT